MISEGKKADTGKRRFSLFPLNVLIEVIDVLEHGAQKYGVGNWEKVENARERYYDAAQRHLFDWYMGEIDDKETGKHNLTHAICCLVFLVALDKKK